MSFEIEVSGGSSVRLPTAGKYCDRDIVVTATGGGGGVETCMVHVSFNMYNDYGQPLYIEYSKIENGKPVKGSFSFAGEFDDVIGEYYYPSQREYDFEVLSGSYMIIYDSNWCGVAVSGDIYNTNVYGTIALAFVPSGKTNANITLTY